MTQIIVNRDEGEHFYVTSMIILLLSVRQWTNDVSRIGKKEDRLTSEDGYSPGNLKPSIHELLFGFLLMNLQIICI